MHTPTSKTLLYCLPFAGGNTLSYREFQTHVHNTIQIKAIELPGRGKRMREPLLTDAKVIVADAFTQIQSEITNQRYAIYGHSMGALLGYLLTKRILSCGQPAPVHLIVSGRRAPSVTDDKPLKHLLSKEAFLTALKDMGGFPLELLAHKELIDFFEPILRTDFRAIETYSYQPTSSFDIPITILHGLNDEEVTYAELLPWQQETQQPIAIKQFPGGHFFIFEHLAQIGQVFSRTLI
jgi:surfactin synthase thioesterase subunit